MYVYIHVYIYVCTHICVYIYAYIPDLRLVKNMHEVFVLLGSSSLGHIKSVILGIKALLVFVDCIYMHRVSIKSGNRRIHRQKVGKSIKHFFVNLYLYSHNIFNMFSIG